MLEQIIELLKVAGAVLLFITLWLISVAIVFRDVNRRRLNGLEQFLWLAAAALLPVIGFLIYWVARLLTRLLLTDSIPQEDPRLRLTAVKPSSQSFRPPLVNPAQAPGHKSTIPALGPQPPQPSAYAPSPSAQPQAGYGQPAHSAPYHPSIFSLVATEGPFMGGKFQIVYLPARIGRGSSVLISLNADQGVSRQHAEIYQAANGALHLRDLNSTHGTFVNGKRILDTRLNLGDRVTIGQSTFIFTESRG